MERTFKVGESVWVYESSRALQEGEVTEVTFYGGVRVQTANGRRDERVYTPHMVFHRPGDLEVLVAQLRDDADHLLRAAQAMEER